MKTSADPGSRLSCVFGSLLAIASCGAQSLITPTSITFAGTAVEFFAEEANLINDSGLSGTPTIANYTTITHGSAGAANAWVTTNPAGAGDFFSVGQTVVFNLSFDRQYRFSALVFWGYHFGGANGNEGRRFELAFSNDGGTSFLPPVIVERPLGSATVANAATLNLPSAVDANFVRVTVLDNHFGAIQGGDRVGLGEIRFLGDIPRDPWIGKAPVSSSSTGSPVVVNFPVTNQGTTNPLNLTAASFTGFDASMFTVTSTFPIVVAPGQTRNVTALFNPASFVGLATATMEVSSNDSLAPTVSIPVSMTVAIPNASFPASAAFGPVANGAPTPTFSIQIGNTGSGTLNILDAFVVDPSVATSISDRFTITTDFINNPPAVAPAAQGNVAFTFNPAGLKGGIYPTVIRIVTDDPDTPTADVRVTVDLGLAPGSTLAAWWPLETDGNDASGNGHHGVTAGVVDFTVAGASGATGGSAEFGGASSIDVPFNEALNPSSYTVTLWANPDTVAANYNSAITSRYDGVNTVGRVFGYVVYRAPGAAWEYWTGSGLAGLGWGVTGPAPATAGSWVHLAVSYDHVAKVKTLYADGVAVQTATDVVAARNLLRDLHLGGGGDLGTDFRFDGKLDDIAVFREVLDATEINAIRTTGVSGFTGLPLPPGESPRAVITGVSIVGGNLVIEGVSGLVNGQSYHIEQSTALDIFTPVPGSTFTGGGVVPVVPAIGPRRFIRIVAGPVPGP